MVYFSSKETWSSYDCDTEAVQLMVNAQLQSQMHEVAELSKQLHQDD